MMSIQDFVLLCPMMELSMVMIIMDLVGIMRGIQTKIFQQNCLPSHRCGGGCLCVTCLQ